MDSFDSEFGGIEDLFNRLAGRQGSFQRSHAANNNGDILETIPVRKGTFFIFDFSSRNVSQVEITDDVEENEYGERVHTGRKILQITFRDQEKAKYVLPKDFKRNKLEWTTTNGILEVFLRK